MTGSQEVRGFESHRLHRKQQVNGLIRGQVPQRHRAMAIAWESDPKGRVIKVGSELGFACRGCCVNRCRSDAEEPNLSRRRPVVHIEELGQAGRIDVRRVVNNYLHDGRPARGVRSLERGHDLLRRAHELSVATKALRD